MEPLILRPYLRPMVWGGRRLADRLGKPLPPEGTFGEAWEVSVHASHITRVAEGPYADTPLDELCLEETKYIFGESVPLSGQFPLLIKYLDCHDFLSIQVHPTDSLVRQYCVNEENGKTEAWVVMHADPGSRIWAGLKPGVTAEDLKAHLADGTTEQCLHSFEPKPGDFVYIPAGTVHGVGGGVLLAEVQQSSDATFRLHDWNRVGLDGKPRPLHIRESLAAIHWDTGPVHPTSGVPLGGLPPGLRGERLVKCEYFQLDRYRPSASFVNPYPNRLSVWMVLSGKVEIRGYSTRYRRPLSTGETVFVPAASGAISFHPIPSPEPLILMAVSLPIRHRAAA